MKNHDKNREKREITRSAKNPHIQSPFSARPREFAKIAKFCNFPESPRKLHIVRPWCPPLVLKNGQFWPFSRNHKVPRPRKNATPSLQKIEGGRRLPFLRGLGLVPPHPILAITKKCPASVKMRQKDPKTPKMSPFYLIFTEAGHFMAGKRIF